MALNMKTLTQALAKTAAVIEKTVQTTVQEVTGPKPLQDYDLIDQIGSAGPGMAWKLYSAKARDSSRSQQYPAVCVWVLDKRVLSEARARAGLSKSAEDSFLDLIRSDAGRLVKLRHPGVVHVVQALDENKNAMAMVTEPLFASVANVVGNLENVAKVPNELKDLEQTMIFLLLFLKKRCIWSNHKIAQGENGMEMGLLEIKHGLLQIAESLNFLHSNAHLIHRAISPENVLITSNGAWKLAGFGFAIPVDQTSSDMTAMQGFHYSEYDVEDSVLPLQPSLNYTAPELVKSKSSLAGSSSDIFSFGCLAYHLVARKPLFDCFNNVKMYMNSLTYLSTESFASIPRELVPDLQRMLSSNESLRPTAMTFTDSPFFRDDTRLRAIRFLDHMLERDNMQKSDFLKALSDMWKDFDSRILRYKVLPPLCAELRNMVIQPIILPMVFTIAESQDKHDFELSTLPSLVPVLSTASGDTLLLLVKRADLIINKTNQEALITSVLPLIVRAYDDNDARIQEEGLRKSVSLAKQLDTQLVKQTILPRVHTLALKTTVAAVRVNALLCFGELVPMLDKHAVLEILQTIQRCTAVDRSAPTLMCTLGVANSILKQYGIEFVAEHVLPLLTPLLSAQQLNVQQFAKYMLFVKDILRKIEEKRGVAVSDSGISGMKPSLISNGSQSQSSITASDVSVPTIKSRPAWDEDWGPTSKTPASSQSSTGNVLSAPVVLSGQSIAGNSIQTNSVVTTSLSSNQTVASCLPVDIEWPPQNSTSSTPIIADSGMQATTGSSSTSSLDGEDPFADWPPRPSGSLAGASGASNNGVVGPSKNKYGTGSSMTTPNSLNFQTNDSASWTLNNQNTSEPMIQNHGTSTFNSSSPGSGGINSLNSIGFQKQNQGIPSQLTYDADKKSTDLGSIFAPSKSDHNIAPRLAPPPTTAIGRGRGRGRGVSSTLRSTQNKSSSGQPPLMDLL